MSQPGLFPHGSDKKDHEVPEHSDAVFFTKGADNFLSDDTTIIPTTDNQVRVFLFCLDHLGTRDSFPFNFTLQRDFVTFDITFREFLGNSFLVFIGNSWEKPFTNILETI